MNIADVPLPDQIAEIRREIEMRNRTYPRLLASGRMVPREAERHMINIRAVLNTLEQVRDMRLRLVRGD